MVKILKMAAVALLVILPYSTVLSGFSPYLSHHSFQTFLEASFIFVAISLLLGWLVSAKIRSFPGAGLFLLMGVLTAPALMLGPPEISPRLIERIAEEHFRYGLLILATLIFAAGFILIVKSLWQGLSFSNRLILIPFGICTALMLWDNISSYRFSSELSDWIGKDRNALDFFSTYDYQVLLRTFGRSLVYIVIPWLAFILLRGNLLKKWQFVVLAAFSIPGIVFFFLCNFISIQFYFPFMVPAIALAPAYWLGIILIGKPIVAGGFSPLRLQTAR